MDPKTSQRLRRLQFVPLTSGGLFVVLDRIAGANDPEVRVSSAGVESRHGIEERSDQTIRWREIVVDLRRVLQKRRSHCCGLCFVFSDILIILLMMNELIWKIGPFFNCY